MKRFTYYFLFLITLTASHTVLGAETAQMTYTPLVGVPGIETGTVISIEEYVKVLYYLSITVAGLLAVVQIIYGGVEWTFSDAFTEKSSAKTRIQGALLGLLIVLSAVLILNTINTNLTVLNIFGNAPAVGSSNAGNAQKAPTACSINPNSAQCCTERKGKYTINGRTGTGTCVVGTLIFPNSFRTTSIVAKI